MKKLNYVSPEAMYILLDEEDILTASVPYDEEENSNDQEHDAGNL